MYVKEGLVFNKLTGSVTGFVDLGDINNHFNDMENLINNESNKRPNRPLAKTLLVFMIRGAVTNFVFPYALYPAKSPKGCDLFPILWDVIERLTRNSFRVLAVTSDGASCNRNLFQMHAAKKKDGTGAIYRTKNIFSVDGDYIYFISDPPHLLKTIRNCFANFYGYVIIMQFCN